MSQAPGSDGAPASSQHVVGIMRRRFADLGSAFVELLLGIFWWLPALVHPQPEPRTMSYVSSGN